MSVLTIAVTASRVLHAHMTRTPFHSVAYRKQPLLALSPSYTQEHAAQSTPHNESQLDIEPTQCFSMP